MLIDTDTLMSNLSQLAAGELAGDTGCRTALRDMGIFRRERGHGGNWVYNEVEKVFAFDVDAIDKAGVKYFIYSENDWKSNENQERLPF